MSAGLGVRGTPRLWARFDMLDHECHDSPCWSSNGCAAVQVKGGRERGIVMMSCCCLLIVVSREYVGACSRDCAINTRLLGVRTSKSLLPFPTTNTGYQ